MRRGVWLLVLGVLLAALGAASAFAAGTTTTTTTTTTTSTTSTTSTTTTTTTTTGTTTTAPTPPGYSPLPPSYLPKSCVGAGAAAIAVPGRPVLGLGTPASSRGPSAYPAKSPIVRFLSSTATGAACGTAHVVLGSVSLFGGVVTASSIEATHGQGTVGGFEIYGAPVTLRAGRAVRIGGWGEVTLEKTVGRLTAPLVVQLLVTHRGLPAGTTIAFAFGAAPQVLHNSEPKHHAAASRNHGRTRNQGKRAGNAKKNHRPPPDFPASPDPFLSPGLLTLAARRNDVVSTAMQYLGVRYQWGGASPKTGFDCSGLVTYVFGKLGVSLPHYTVSQWHSPDGVWVAPNRLLPGDLVFFVGSDGTRKAPGHVGIYVGDGYIIDAPHTGSFVRIDRLNEPRLADGYVGARRIDSQLLVARHLLGVTNAAAEPFPYQLGFGTSGAGPLVGTLRLTSAPVAASRSNVPWLVGGPLGAVLALSVIAGAFTFRRRRRTAPDPSS
jgi:cell wall-associated NlpC family hydrolase